MSSQVQFRRGTTTQNNAFTGAVGEITYDTDAKVLRLHDGSTAGGGATVLTTGATQTVLNKTFGSGSVWNGGAIPLAYGGTGSALTATAGAVHYSTASGTGLTLQGTSGQLLSSGGTGSPSWISASALTVGTAAVATTASNIAGGSAGQLMIQSDVGVTSFITAGAAGTFLKSAGAGYAPQWATGAVTYGNTTVALGGNSAGVLNGITTLNSDLFFVPLPRGNIAQRPGGSLNSNLSPQLGMVRYNTEISSFEGYGAGSAWSSLGGVKSVDGKAYIQAETSAGAADDVIRVYAGDSGTSTQVMWASTSNIKILPSTAATSTSTGALQVTGGASVQGDLWVAGNVYANAAISVTTSQLAVTAPLVYLAANAYPYNFDTGLYSHFVGGPANVYAHTGMVRSFASNTWNFFSNVRSEPTSTVNWSDTGIAWDTIKAGNVTPGANVAYNLGSTAAWWNVVYGNTFLGRSTSASYADLAENYRADDYYAPGTVVVFGGSEEITISTIDHDSAVAGVISTEPAYLMNSEATGLPVALQGRVPCQVQGPVSKGTVLVTSITPGVAQAIDNTKFIPGCVIGKALAAINTNTIETIEVVVGKH